MRKSYDTAFKVKVAIEAANPHKVAVSTTDSTGHCMRGWSELYDSPKMRVSAIHGVALFGYNTYKWSNMNYWSLKMRKAP